MINSKDQQTGMVTLIVTVLIVLISTVAVLYTNKNVISAQKIATNNYQNSKAAEAAEAGVQVFIAVLQNDLKLLSDADTANDLDTEVLQKKSTSGSTCASALSSLGALAYEFKFGTGGYATNAATSNIFAADRYYSKNITPPETISGVAQGLAYKIRAEINTTTGNINIQSEGCADNSVTTPSISAPACGGNNSPLSLSKRTVNLTGGGFFTGSALSIKGYMDARTTFDTRKPTSSHPSPSCSILTGDSMELTTGVWPETDSGIVTCTSSSNTGCTMPSDVSVNNAALAALSQEAYFKGMMGGKSLDEYKAIADKTITNGSCSGITSAHKIIVFDGDFTDTTCNLRGTDRIVIVTGAVKKEIKVDGILYAQNIHQDGALTVQGVVYVGGDWDIDTLKMSDGTTDRMISCPTNGAPIQNTKFNAKTGGHNAACGASAGSLRVIYDPSKIPPNPFVPSISYKNGTWIDY